MPKKPKKKSNRKKTKLKTTIHEIAESRTGGQNALKGYSYQLLYSCYLILSSIDRNNMSFKLEGLEDIDQIDCAHNGEVYLHIQLKQSSKKQYAYVLKDVLKNFLEIYLIDPNRNFELVYDFPDIDENLKKLFNSNLDDQSHEYWENMIINIKKEYPSGDWESFNFDKFLQHVHFKEIKKDTLEKEIEKVIIRNYDILKDNISLYVNSIKVFCADKMLRRDYITKKDLDNRIQDVKEDISKGPYNPAQQWINKLSFSDVPYEGADGFYEGKKATIGDIINGAPIKRDEIEREIINSIHKNTITVIKASSGQGKTTLALQAAYDVHNEYTIYELKCCNDIHNLNNIFQYFNARIQLGEKILILIDNLNNYLKKWNDLAQLLQSKLPCNYKLIITTRETDWHNYSGDLSNVKSLYVIKPELTKKEAEKIYIKFKQAKKLDPSVVSWEKAWEQVADKKLLIEYIYILTHGEMLSQRISSQINDINRSDFGKEKLKILRVVCFADICGIKVSIKKLFDELGGNLESDYNELLIYLDKEFLLHVDKKGGYIEGLHPVRSMHVVDKLHEFYPIDDTALSLVQVANKEDIAVLFSHFPEFDFDKERFLNKTVDILWDEKDLSVCLSALQGLFSGCVMQYYNKNEDLFFEAFSIGGIDIFAQEICPYLVFDEFDINGGVLEDIKEKMPKNKNIAKLYELKQKAPIFNSSESYIHIFSEHLYKLLCQYNLDEVNDDISYVNISEWLYNIDHVFNLSSKFPLENIWKHPYKYTIDSISKVMYISFCGNKENFENFVKNNLDQILLYLKHQTKSLEIYVDNKDNAIHVNYILRSKDTESANDESVTRIKYVCKTLPIYKTYCADAIKPKLKQFSIYEINDDSHKEMPISNVVKMFHSEMVSLWNRTILSNFESDSLTDWLGYWFNVRNTICFYIEKCCNFVYRCLQGNATINLAKEIDRKYREWQDLFLKEKKYPKANYLFDERTNVSTQLESIKIDYFQSMENVSNSFPGFISKNEKQTKTFFNDLTKAKNKLEEMQSFFGNMIDENDLLKENNDLINKENSLMEEFIEACYYYTSHSENSFFDKYQVSKWYEKNLQDNLKNIKNSLKNLQNITFVKFPKASYTDGILRYYPIIVDENVLESEEKIDLILYESKPFAQFDYNYLVYLFINQKRQIYNSGLLVPKNMYAEEVNINETIDSLQTKLSLPRPIEITSKMLDCFDEKYILINNKNNDSTIVLNLAEELWFYSKIKILLAGPDDSDYQTEELNNSKKKIENYLLDLECTLPANEIQNLKEVCKNVFNGSVFGDREYNVFSNDVIKNT